jgi:hypothetical protein
MKASRHWSQVGAGGGGNKGVAAADGLVAAAARADVGFIGLR